MKYYDFTENYQIIKTALETQRVVYYLSVGRGICDNCHKVDVVVHLMKWGLGSLAEPRPYYPFEIYELKRTIPERDENTIAKSYCLQCLKAGADIFPPRSDWDVLHLPEMVLADGTVYYPYRDNPNRWGVASEVDGFVQDEPIDFVEVLADIIENENFTGPLWARVVSAISIWSRHS